MPGNLLIIDIPQLLKDGPLHEDDLVIRVLETAILELLPHIVVLLVHEFELKLGLLGQLGVSKEDFILHALTHGHKHILEDALAEDAVKVVVVESGQLGVL
jgi:hypothetical protein